MWIPSKNINVLNMVIMISIPFNGIVFDIDMKMMLFISFNTLHTKNEENINKQTI